MGLSNRYNGDKNVLRHAVCQCLSLAFPGVIRRVYHCVLMALVYVLVLPQPSAAVPPGTRIDNTALATYQVGSTSNFTSTSNTVETVTVVIRTPSELTFLSYAPASTDAQVIPVLETAYSSSGTASGPFNLLPPPIPSGSSTPLDISNPLPLVPTDIYHQGDPIFIRLTDLDQNLDPLMAETVLVNITNEFLGDGALLQLTETGPNTGVFVGYIQSDYDVSAENNNGSLTVEAGTQIGASYIDSSDGTDATSAAVLVDPYGMVFDSSTGLPVDGVQVTLFDTVSGLPAVVFGEDGLTPFPATVNSGATVMDSNGNSYVFPDGGFRFPFVAPGTYRLDVVTPAGWQAPSVESTATLQALPGGPFVIVEPGSRGEPFTLNPGPALHIDIPIDPVIAPIGPGDTPPWITKSVNQDRVSQGDFIQYRVSVQNPAPDLMRDVTLIDELPSGFRFQTDSLKIDGLKSADPDISSDGRTLTITLGNLLGDTTTSVRYVVEVTAGARPGKATNSAAAVTATGLRSNTARASVKVTEELFRSHSIIMGRVIPGGCQDTGAEAGDGVEGVRIFLEDGTYVITDKRGLYHFEGVRPGVHVVQLDLDSLSETYEVLACEENTRFAGRSFSQFVDLKGGTLWRADFYVGLKPRLRDEVSLEITSGMQDGVLNYGVNLQGGRVPLRNLRLTIMLPDGGRYVRGSSTLNDGVLPDPMVTENMLTYRLGDVPDEWIKALQFQARIAPDGEDHELLTKGMLIFDTPSKKNQQTPLVDNILVRIPEEKHEPQPDMVLLLVPEEKRMRETEIVTYPDFASFSSELSQQYRAELDTLLEKVKKLDIHSVEVTGHSDNKPIRARSRHIYGDNYALSLSRAKSVGQYLSNRLGIDMSQMTIQGKGPDEPIESNKTAQGRALNRRVTVKILSEKVVLDICSAGETDMSGTPGNLPLDTHVGQNEKQDLERLVTELSHVQVTDLFITYEVGPPGTQPPVEVNGVGVGGAQIVPTARARSVGKYLAEALHLDPAQVIMVPKGPQELTYQGEDPTGVVWNCPVQVRVLSQQIHRSTSLQVKKTNDQTVVATEGLRPGETWLPAEVETATPGVTPDDPETWVETADPALEWLWPGPAYSPAIPSLKFAVKHDPKHTLTLLLNGREVEPLNFEGMKKNTTGTVAVSRWAGVDLEEGDNRFDCIVHDASGNKIDQIKRVVHYSGPPVHVDVIPEQSNLITGGKDLPMIAIRLTDRDGHPVREGMIGTFLVEKPHAAEETLDALQKNPLSGLNKQNPHYIVGKNGVAFLRLQSASPSGEVRLRVFLADGKEEELRVWLNPEARDWILVGLAEGTMGYNTLTGHMESADTAGIDDDIYDDGRIAFYAKGSIKGEWLLTMAYDNKKVSDESGRSLYQTIDPDTYYTLYGDETQQNYDAPSSDKLYLKIERHQFYALFGDYDTGLTVTELSRYSRSLNGFKSEMKGTRFSYNIFASETNQTFVKDEIRGDGTSGLYYLSRKNIVMNSEKIVIEARDRFRSEVIVSTRSLTRHMDYNIDYDDGTLFFKEPIFSRDDKLNPIYIVVDYESYDTTDEAFTYGGRGAVKLMGDTLEVGASYIHEGSTGAEADLEGVDATLNLGANTELRVEIATSERVEDGTDYKGDAYLAELTHQSHRFDGQLYVREQETGFGLGQQKASETGTRKMGADALFRLTDAFNVHGEVYRNVNLDTDAERDLGELDLNYTLNLTTLRTGFRHAEDRFADGTSNSSDQIFAGISQRMFHDRLQLRVDREQSLGSNDDNPDFPTRTILGADLKLTDSVVLYGEQEYTEGEYEDTESTRLGMKVTPWSGAEANTSVEQQSDEYGPRTFANLGLRQTMTVDKKWAIDAGLDHSRTLDEPGDTPDSVDNGSSSENDHDFTAVSLGSTYREDSWSWTSRTEYRTTDSQDKWGVTTGLYSEPATDIGLSSAVQLFRTEPESGAHTTDADIRFGLAYRPAKTRWIILDRLDFKVDDQEDSDSSVENWRVVNNMNANVKPNRETQVSFQYGLKYVGSTIDDDQYSGYTDLMGVEGRYDITPKWDVGLAASVLHTWQSDAFDYSTGVSIGHHVVKNAWLSIGYNFLGFKDEDFSETNYTAQGPFIQFRFKFDQNSVQEALKKFVSYHEYGGGEPNDE
jgi:uncharacterized repeat protein (TIGR01451 family)